MFLLLLPLGEVGMLNPLFAILEAVGKQGNNLKYLSMASMHE